MIPVDPDAPEARQWLREELSKAQYQAAEPTWFDRLSRSFLDWLTSLTAPAGDALGAWLPVILTLVITAVLVAAYLIVGPPRLRRLSRPPEQIFGDDDPRGAEDLRRAAAAAAAAGDWTLAGEEMFRALARGLIERSVLLVTPGTTAHAFADRAAVAFPEHSAGLTEAAASFDRLRYLGNQGTQRDYLLILTLDGELKAARPRRLESLTPTGGP
jgi:hypothetical protein